MTDLATSEPSGAGDAHSGEPTDGPLTFDELRLAFRNRGMPLEAMRHDITPTGLHYLLIHWDIPDTDAATWQVTIDGSVERPLSVSLDDIRSRPRTTIPVTMECAGNGRARLTPRPLSVPWLTEAVSTAEWTGTPVWPILEEAGVLPSAVEAVFEGADRGLQREVEQTYERSLTIGELRRPEVLLAYEMNGQPLEPQHGYPLRLLVPGWYGMASVKWLTSIRLVDEPFEGFQQAKAYRYQEDPDDPGEPVTRQRVRALMIPPGIPDFFTRHRFLDPGPTRITGRAWSGVAPVTRVEVAVDGRWADAALDEPVGRHAWRGWTFDWEATEGDHELVCRATDAADQVQPADPPWNRQGMGVNHAQRVEVTVR